MRSEVYQSNLYIPMESTKNENINGQNERNEKQEEHSCFDLCLENTRKKNLVNT